LSPLIGPGEVPLRKKKNPAAIATGFSSQKALASGLRAGRLLRTNVRVHGQRCSWRAGKAAIVPAYRPRPAG